MTETKSETAAQTVLDLVAAHPATRPYVISDLFFAFDICDTHTLSETDSLYFLAILDVVRSLSESDFDDLIEIVDNTLMIEALIA